MKVIVEAVTFIVFGFLVGIGVYLGQAFCQLVFN
jgi:hypothetical protein